MPRSVEAAGCSRTKFFPGELGGLGPVWYPIGHEVFLEELDGFTLSYANYIEFLFAERWHWTPSDLDGMLISERERFVEILAAAVAREKRSIPTSPNLPAG